METQALPQDMNRIFVVFPVFEEEIHNALYALDLFVLPLSARGYSVTAVVFSDKHGQLIRAAAPRCQIARIRGRGFIAPALSWLRFLLAHTTVPRLPPHMKARWRRQQLEGAGLARQWLRAGTGAMARWIGADRIRRLHGWLARRGEAQDLYRAQRPFLTLLPFYCSRAEEMEILAAARHSRSLSVGLPARISTGDDVFYYARPDLLLVWNAVMREQILGWHGGDRDTVAPVGMVKCDYYRRQDYGFQTRAEFVRQNGLAENKKIISIICGNIRAQRACELAVALFKSGSIPSAFQVLLRANPDEFEQQRHSLAAREGFPIFLVRGFSSDTTRQSLRDQIISTGSFLKNSDVVISVASTMSLESLYFDVPNIYLLHDEFRFFYDFDWAGDLLQEPGFKRARNDGELIAAINECLEDPVADRAARENLFRKYCYSTAGDARDRCFEQIHRRLENFPGRSSR